MSVTDREKSLRCVHTVVLLYDIVFVQKYVYDILLDRTRSFLWCQTKFCPNGRTQHITSFVYEDQCASDLFDEKTTISSSEWRDLVLLYVVHVCGVQKIQHGWRTSYSYTHTYYCTYTTLRRSYTYKSTRQNILVYDRVDAPSQCRGSFKYSPCEAVDNCWYIYNYFISWTRLSHWRIIIWSIILPHMIIENMKIVIIHSIKK